MIVSSVPGRLRIKLPLCQRPCLMPLQEQLQQLEFVNDVALHPASRSLIVHYERRCPVRDMESRVQAQLPAVEPQAVEPQIASRNQDPDKHSRLKRGLKQATQRRSINRWAKVTAMVSLPLSIALVYAGHKRWHAATGWLFVGAVASHIYIHRKNTFR